MRTGDGREWFTEWPPPRCDAKYGRHKQRVCRRLAGHTGGHWHTLTPWELRRIGLRK